MRTERMGIRVRFAGAILEQTGGETASQVVGATVRDVLERLFLRHPTLRFCLFHPDDPNRVRALAHVFHNAKEVRDAQDLATPVKDGDELTITADVA